MDSDFFATFISRPETSQLTSADMPMTAIPAKSRRGENGSDASPSSLTTASRMITIAATKISNASMNPETSSNFPCPNEWAASGGSEDFRTEKKAMMAARRSIAEWIASEMILTDPMATPTTSFMRTSPVLEMTESRAVFCLSRLISARSGEGDFMLY
jgi:hypothetical protein